MAITSGFFNSVNGDRRYKADFFAEYFASFISNGVFPNPSTGMQVIANGNMTVSIRSGKAWIKGYYVNNDADYLLSLGVADGVLKRIDRIVLRLDFSSRQITPVVKKGTAASIPTAPSLQRDADAYEIGLADVLISNGAISISQANITDNRLNTTLCGIVHGVVDQVDTTTIFNQYQAWFNSITSGVEAEVINWQAEQQQSFTTWFQSIKDILSGDVAANLASRISQIENDFTAHQADYVKHPGTGKTTNSGNAYAVTLNPAPALYDDQMGVVITVNANSTGACTLNINGLGAKPIKKANGNDVTNLKANGLYTLRYNAGTGNFLLQGEGASGNAVASDLLSGKTASTDAGDLVGTMSNNGALTITPAKSNQVIPQGYHNGSGYVKGDANLITSNILSGKSIFGVTGNVIPKQYASGTGTMQNYNSTTMGSDRISRYNLQDGTGGDLYNSLNYLKVTGLAFEPIFIKAYYDSPFSDNYLVIYMESGVLPKRGDTKFRKYAIFRQYDTGLSGDVYDNFIGNRLYVNSTGFVIPVPTNAGSIRWEAWG